VIVLCKIKLHLREYAPVISCCSFSEMYVCFLQFCRNAGKVTYFQWELVAYYSMYGNQAFKQAKVSQVHSNLTFLFHLIVTVKCPRTRGTTSFDHLRRHLKHLWEAFSILSSEASSAPLQILLCAYESLMLKLGACRSDTYASWRPSKVLPGRTGRFLSSLPSLSVSLSIPILSWQHQNCFNRALMAGPWKSSEASE